MRGCCSKSFRCKTEGKPGLMQGAQLIGTVYTFP